MARTSSEILFKDLLKEESNNPLYIQLYESIRSAILEGRLKPGEKLPSTRDISTYLKLSRSTVLIAFDMLLSEGYLIAKTGSGSFVNEEIPEKFITVHKTGVTFGSVKSRSVSLSNYGKNIDKSVYLKKYPETIIPFQPGIPAFSEFPREVWSKIAARTTRELKPSDMTYTNSSGHESLRRSIAGYIRLSRGVKCSPDQIIITSGSQQSLSLIANLFLNKNDDVIMEDPVYGGAAEALTATGAKIKYVPVEQDGINVKQITKAKSIPKLIYVTPSHQYPLGHTMSVQKRMQLLKWVSKKPTLIIEDDYDSEFRYTGNPLSSLQGMDESGNVIYVGTFSKVLFPSLRIGYIVLPENLIDIFTKAKNISDRNSPMLEQLILSRFIDEGHFGRYLRKMRMIYRERQEFLIREFNELLGSYGTINPCKAGLHSVANLKSGFNADAVFKEALNNDLYVPALISYCKKRKDLNGLVLGYAAFTKDELKSGLKNLLNVFKKLSKR